MGKRNRFATAGALMTLLLILSSCGGEASNDAPPPGEATETSTVDATVDGQTSVGGDIAALATDDAFAGPNDQSGMEQAVAKFNTTGLDFSPDALATSIPESCAAIDAELVGEIFGVGLMVDPDEFPLPTGDGFLSCTLLSTERPEVAMMYVHFAPDLNGEANEFGEGWGAVGTMEGAFELGGLGDGARWSDGSRGENLTNMSMLQLLVDQGGTQSYLQLQGNEPQLELVGAWSAPKMILALSAINGSLT